MHATRRKKRRLNDNISVSTKATLTTHTKEKIKVQREESNNTGAKEGKENKHAFTTKGRDAHIRREATHAEDKKCSLVKDSDIPSPILPGESSESDTPAVQPARNTILVGDSGDSDNSSPKIPVRSGIKRQGAHTISGKGLVKTKHDSPPVSDR